MSVLVKKASELFFGQKKKKKKDTEPKGVTPEIQEPVKKVEESKEEKPEMKLKDRGKIFVGGITPATTSEDLKAHFSQFGTIVDAVVLRFASGKSRGYGFVTFACLSAAEQALAVDSHVVNGKHVDIRAFTSKPRGSKHRRKTDRRLFLGGLPPGVEETSLKEFFARYGEVTDVVIPTDKNDKKTDFAFLSFAEKESADKCLAEEFVHLGGRRVVIRKAKDREESKEDGPDVDDAVECCESDEESTLGCGGDVTSLPDDDSLSSSTSGGKTVAFEQVPEFLNLLQDYFQSKIAHCNESIEMDFREKDGKWQPSSKDVTEMELLLSRFLMNSSRETTASFFNEDESSVSSEESTDDEEDDSDESVEDSESGCELLPENTSSALEELNAKFMKLIIERQSLEKVPPAKPSLPQHNSEHVSQRSSAPFKIKDKSGSLVCSVCDWSAANGSSESFLAHCTTPAHRAKIKERFQSEQEPQEIFPRSIPSQKVCNKKEESTTEESQATKKMRTRRKKSQPDQMKSEPKEKPQKQPQKNTGTQGVQKKPQNLNQNPEKKQSKGGQREIPNLKVHALAKGMVCIQPLSPHELSCKMCNKVIPKAPDFGTLMKNVSTHLQSKKHLNKLAETEDSLKNALNKDSGKSDSTNQKKADGKNATPKQPPPQKQIPKRKTAASGGATGKCEKTAPNKKMAETPATKLYLCLICNYFASKMVTFNTHINSKAHADAIKEANTDLGDCVKNSTVCKGCNRVLFGPLANVNRHVAKCLAKKG